MTVVLGHATVDLLDVPLAAVDLDEAVARVGDLVGQRRFAHVATANVDFLAQAGKDPSLAAILQRADLVVADGVPLLWMARWQGTPLPERVNGTDLVVRLLAEAGRQRWPVYFLGGDPGVAEASAAAAAERFGTRSAGAAAPGPEEMADPVASARIAAAVEQSGAAMLLLAIGGGRQELWIDRHRDELGRCVAIGVGSALDFVAGTRPRAPRWMQRAGLEWLFRLGIEPRRLWRRYLVDDPAVLLRFFASRRG